MIIIIIIILLPYLKIADVLQCFPENGGFVELGLCTRHNVLQLDDPVQKFPNDKKKFKSVLRKPKLLPSAFLERREFDGDVFGIRTLLRTDPEYLYRTQI